MSFELEVYRCLAEARMEQARKLTLGKAQPKIERRKRQRKLEPNTHRPLFRTRKVG